jgi:hypothetical protein
MSGYDGGNLILNVTALMVCVSAEQPRRFNAQKQEQVENNDNETQVAEEAQMKSSNNEDNEDGDDDDHNNNNGLSGALREGGLQVAG